MFKSMKPRDRLSELSDSLIFKIFELLPMQYVVKTAILSQRWKNLWQITPSLYFENDFANDDGKDEFRNFVNRCLLGWRGKKIETFKVSGCDFDSAFFSDVDLWLRFAVDNGVEELYLSFRGVYDDENDTVYYRVPPCLYSCSSLRRLSLFGSVLDISGNAKHVQWSRLLNLTIQGFDVTARAVNLILFGSPVLEVFDLSLDASDENSSLCFRSSSLKELSICKNLTYISVRKRGDTELVLWTPNLERLKILGVPYDKCLMLNVLSLTRVTLWFYEVYDYDEFGSFCTNDYLGETLSQIVPAIQHVERLTLLDWCIKVLGAMTSKCPLSPFSNVKFLSLNGSFREHEQIISLLEIFPKLKTLVVEEGDVKQHYAKSKVKFKPNPSKSFLMELTTVEVTWTNHDFSIFPLVKSLLKYASKLEKMVFRVKGIVPHSTPSNSLLSASRALLRMPRSSPTSELILCEINANND